MKEKHPNRKTAFVYLKTGDQSSYAEIGRHEWTTFTRRELLEVLKGGEGKVSNAIFQGFLAYLKEIERAVQAFLTTPPSKWDSRAWSGFFLSLQTPFGAGDWGYVSNPSGGFMGFWWGWCPVDGGDVYLQIEQLKLVVKLQVDLPARRSELRDVWSKRVREGILDPRFARPRTLRSGNWMTVAVHEGEWISKKQDGCIDSDSTIVTLKRVTAALKALSDATQGAAQDPQEGPRDATIACPAPEPECSR